MLNADRTADERLELVIVNTGDRPVQIGSHLHLPDANTALDFDRDAAEGFRLDIPSGTSQRFEPGASREVPSWRCAGAAWCPASRSQAEGRAMVEIIARGVRRALRADRPATRSGSATPTCGSRSRTT